MKDFLYSGFVSFRTYYSKVILYGVPLGLLWQTVLEFAKEPSFKVLFWICLPVLATLLSFSALLYTRASCLPSGPSKKNCLYAAERSTQSTIVFLHATLGGVIATYLSSLNSELSKGVATFFSIVSISLAMLAFVSFHMAFFAISKQFFQFLSDKEIDDSVDGHTNLDKQDLPVVE